MAINWKGWTARLPVKICCIVLVVAMAFVFLLGGVQLVWANVGSVDEGMLFTDFKDNNYFFDNMAFHALSQVQTAFSYQSEENIRNMGCLAWEPTDYYYSDESEEEWLELVSTNLVNSRQEWGKVRAEDLESPGAKQLLEGAINNQVSEYYAAQDWLDSAGGLFYYITDDKQVLTNAPEQSEDFFGNQPVYILINGRSWEQSRTETASSRYRDYWDSRDDQTVYIAYSQQAVDYHNGVWKGIQRQLLANLSLMTGAALVALAALVVLLCGAGRRYADTGKAVRFTALDKPWLDFGLFVLVFYEVAVCYWIFASIELAWRYDNLRWSVALCALLTAGFTLPLLGWILNLAKRCKAGKWWRHTMVYRIYSKFRGFLRSLWAGVPLTARVALIGFALLMATVVILFFDATEFGLFLCLLFTAAAVFLMLRYARRLHLLEQGAKVVAGGSYNTPIAVKGGELGSVAASINSISEGINAAVAERMKSERFKTELITNVSHDIRTPLTSLITYTDLLKSEGLDSEKAPEYLEILIQKSARLKTLTDDLFEASKAASGSIEVHPEAMDLADFVRQVLGELDERVRDSGLDFRLNLPEHAPVKADGRLLWRVMENLLSNVFKYALKCSRVYIDVVPEHGGFRLEVKNISEHPLNVDPSELTERFIRGDSARTDEGSGLGLSIAQSFVQAQGGRFALSIDGDLFKAIICLPGERAAL